MQATSPERSNLAQAAVVSLATFAALALLGMVLAYWTWTWFAQRPEPRAPALAQTGGGMEAAYGLFGGVERGGTGATPTASTVRLLGVVAASGTRSGYAVLRLDAKQTVAMREGGEIEPGYRLAEVHADHVVLVRNGVREALAWPQKNAGAESAAPPMNK